ncbi:beta-glucuronidase-like [Rhopilema esculentum]|uniref:beta-glucuronidase-like n=1 Tax=Rhopilema esculentum TaxID=499914 RepID=UPI0031CE9875|eukprot:gene15062-6227_t
MTTKEILVLVIICEIFIFLRTECLLYPRESESREVKDISGLWSFRADNSTNRNLGFEKEWWQKPLQQTGDVILMPVPSSYNDITQDWKLRDFVGWVWYEREVFIPSSWKDSEKLRVVLRFDSCHYNCIVWMNGEHVMKHEGGHLPFESDVSDMVDFGLKNRITVAVNNTLTPTTLPPGSIEYMNDTKKYPPGYFIQNLQMDFFNYAGIHRPVRIYTTPTAYLSSITIDTDFEDKMGLVKIETTVAAMEDVEEEDLSVQYTLFDANDEKVASAEGTALFKTMLNISEVMLWWPIGMSPKPGYLYTLKVTTLCKTGTSDVYRLPIGIRTVDIKDNKFLINDQEFYFRGFGRHEDANIRGKGLDLPILVKDFNMMKWMGANSFRTSHYPYAEEDLFLADREGFVVIDESPGVGIEEDNMGTENLRHHLKVMEELVHRDKNHPSVVMWSVANEPKSQYQIAEAYFRSVIEYTRKLDPNRPVTFVTNQRADSDKVVKYTDVICVNRYYAWYHDPGHTELIQRQFDSALTDWFETFKKPVLQAEYGADAVPGLHREPSVVFSEEYQVDTIKQYFPVFDKYRKSFLVGEMLWNLADFATKQDLTRVGGNKKGILTRNRQPKMAAHVLRERYLKLAKEESDEWDNDIIRSLIRD